MKIYQVYSLDGNGGISGNRTINAATDEEAIFAVRSMQRPLDTEIWLKDRRIARIPGYHG